MTAAPRCPQNGNKSLSTLSAAGEPRAGSQPAPRAHTSPENIPSAAGRARPGRPRTISGLAPASKAHAGLFQIFPPLPLTFLHSAPPPAPSYSLSPFIPAPKQTAQPMCQRLPAPSSRDLPGLRRLRFGEGRPWGGLLTKSRRGLRVETGSQGAAPQSGPSPGPHL